MIKIMSYINRLIEYLNTPENKPSTDDKVKELAHNIIEEAIDKVANELRSNRPTVFSFLFNKKSCTVDTSLFARDESFFVYQIKDFVHNTSEFILRYHRRKEKYKNLYTVAELSSFDTTYFELYYIFILILDKIVERCKIADIGEYDRCCSREIKKQAYILINEKDTNMFNDSIYTALYNILINAFHEVLTEEERIRLNCEVVSKDKDFLSRLIG